VRGGRYRFVRVSMWGDRELQRLSPNAKLLLVNLCTGSSSNMAGIGQYYIEALTNETGLSTGEIESAFLELEKRPAPAKSFVVRADRVFWVRDQLADDPALEAGPSGMNIKHRRGIETILGELPKDNPAVKKFRAYYKFYGHTPPKGPRNPMKGAKEPLGNTGYRTPEQDSGTGDRRTDTGERRAREERTNSLDRDVVVTGSGSDDRSTKDHDQTNGALKGSNTAQGTAAERLIRSRGYVGMQVVTRLQDWERAVEAGAVPSATGQGGSPFSTRYP
jgi:hypothetical protein